MAFTSKKMRLEKNLIDRFANNLNSFSKPSRTKKHAIYFSYHQPLFSFLPACVDTRKINLGGCVLVQDSIIVMTLNLTGWHLQVKRCVWNRILLIACNENWKPIWKHPHGQIHTQSIFFASTKFFLGKINLGLAGLIGGYMVLKLWMPSPLPRRI